MNWIAKKIWLPIFNRLRLTPENALKFREWSKGKLWVQIPLWILVLWLWDSRIRIGVFIQFVG